MRDHLPSTRNNANIIPTMNALLWRGLQPVRSIIESKPHGRNEEHHVEKGPTTHAREISEFASPASVHVRISTKIPKTRGGSINSVWDACHSAHNNMCECQPSSHQRFNIRSCCNNDQVNVNFNTERMPMTKQPLCTCGPQVRYDMA